VTFPHQTIDGEQRETCDDEETEEEADSSDLENIRIHCCPGKLL
jgi:hypothetical protein